MPTVSFVTLAVLLLVFRVNGIPLGKAFIIPKVLREPNLMADRKAVFSA